MTDKAKPQSRKLVSQPVGPVDKRRHPRGLTRTVKVAIDAMMFDRCTRAEACERAGFTERALYLALAKPEVATYWNQRLVVLRTGERASNILRLADLRDQDDNRAAAVKAVQVLEQLSADDRPGAMMGQATQPGLVIVVVAADAARALPPSPGRAIDLVVPQVDDER